MRHPICLALLLALPCYSVSAADPPKDVKDAEWHKQLNAQFGKGTKRALLIAIDEYKPPLSPLGACVNDAHLLTEVLHLYCGFERDNITVVMNKDATKQNIADKLFAIIKASKPEDTVFVSYGGHGGLIEGRSILCTIDMDPQKPMETGLSSDAIRELLQSKKIAQKILYIDSCHSGAANSEGFKQQAASSQEIAGPFAKASGLITLAGCRRNQTCIDYQKHGVFTGQFARGLAGEADFDKNGIVDSDEIYRHLIMEVPLTAKMVDPKHEQIPVRIIGEDVVGVFAMAKTNGKINAVLGKLPARPKVGDVLENSVAMKLVYLPSDAVVVGSPKKEYLRNDDEAQQPVLINVPIYMGIHEVTQDQYRKVMGKNPSYYSAEGPGSDAVEGMKTGGFPVEQVSWSEAVAFCAKLSALPDEQKARRGYRLPTECEWEFACRAGTETVFSTGETLSSKQANVKGDKPYLDSEEGPTLGRTAVVGSYKPNAFGLYDMHGNVAEWCHDYYVPKRFLSFAGYAFERASGAGEALLALVNQITEADRIEALKQEAEPTRKKKPNIAQSLARPVNPTGPGVGETRVYRGGSFVGDVAFARSACRRDKAPDATYRAIGFRVICFPTKAE